MSSIYDALFDNTGFVLNEVLSKETLADQPASHGVQDTFEDVFYTKCPHHASGVAVGHTQDVLLYSGDVDLFTMKRTLSQSTIDESPLITPTNSMYSDTLSVYSDWSDLDLDCISIDDHGDNMEHSNLKEYRSAQVSYEDFVSNMHHQDMYPIQDLTERDGVVLFALERALSQLTIDGSPLVPPSDNMHSLDALAMYSGSDFLPDRGLVKFEQACVEHSLSEDGPGEYSEWEMLPKHNLVTFERAYIKQFIRSATRRRQVAKFARGLAKLDAMEA